MKKLVFALILLSIHQLSTAQIKSNNSHNAAFERLAVLEDTITLLAKIAVQDTVLSERQAAHERLLPLVREALSLPNAFAYPFSKIENISIQQPKDGTLRVFTWQLCIDKDNYQYFGFVQLNRPKPIVIELTNNIADIPKPEKEFLQPDSWFGCVYYNVKEFKTREGMKYLLFGYNANNADEHIKVCDVLVLRGANVRFGSPVFEVADIAGRKRERLNRLVLTYSADVVVRLNFDTEMNCIVHDHLETMASKNPTIPFTYVPDGTYEAFELKKEVWEHLDKVPTIVLKDGEAPRPTPILDKKGKMTKEEVKNFKFPDN
ncbi:MAG: hypothetical protein U5L45_20535 [Saprospiraceae bacterium]|nr:hypothetical protein [Saprospiraceae bacterium]